MKKFCPVLLLLLSLFFLTAFLPAGETETLFLQKGLNRLTLPQNRDCLFRLPEVLRISPGRTSAGDGTCSVPERDSVSPFVFLPETSGFPHHSLRTDWRHLYWGRKGRVRAGPLC